MRTFKLYKRGKRVDNTTVVMSDGLEILKKLGGKAKGYKLIEVKINN